MILNLRARYNVHPYGPENLVREEIASVIARPNAQHDPSVKLLVVFFLTQVPCYIRGHLCPRFPTFESVLNCNSRVAVLHMVRVHGGSSLSWSKRILDPLLCPPSRGMIHDL